MRQSKPGLGEITSVIIVIAIFAIATPILVYNYYDRADISGGIIRERLDQQRLRAEEQIAISSSECNNSVLTAFLHNYGKTEFKSIDIQRFKIDTNGTLTLSTSTIHILHFNGSADPLVESGDTVIINATGIDCQTERVLLLSDAGNRMVIEP